MVLPSVTPTGRSANAWAGRRRRSAVRSRRTRSPPRRQRLHSPSRKSVECASSRRQQTPCAWRGRDCADDLQRTLTPSLTAGPRSSRKRTTGVDRLTHSRVHQIWPITISCRWIQADSMTSMRFLTVETPMPAAMQCASLTPDLAQLLAAGCSCYRVEKPSVKGPPASSSTLSQTATSSDTRPVATASR